MAGEEINLETIKPGNVRSLSCLGSARFGWISQLRWSPRGDKLAICGGDGVAVYVQGFGGAPTFRLRDHNAPVKGIAFSPDGKLLASCSADTTIALYILSGDSARFANVLAGHTGSVEALAFSPDGKLLASAGADKTIRLWSTMSGVNAGLLQGHRDEVTSLGFAGDGACLYSGGRDGSVRRWDIETKRESAVLGWHDDWIRQIAIEPANTALASGGRDMMTRIWRLDGGDAVAWRAHAGGVDALAYTPDGRLLASGGRDNAIRVEVQRQNRRRMRLQRH